MPYYGGRQAAQMSLGTMKNKVKFFATELIHLHAFNYRLISSKWHIHFHNVLFWRMYWTSSSTLGASHLQTNWSGWLVLTNAKHPQALLWSCCSQYSSSGRSFFGSAFLLWSLESWSQTSCLFWWMHHSFSHKVIENHKSINCPGVHQYPTNQWVRLRQHEQFPAVAREMGITFTLFFGLLQTPKQGADNSLYVALSPKLEGTGGQYFVNCLPTQSSDESYKEDVQRKLWKISCELTGIPEWLAKHEWF